MIHTTNSNLHWNYFLALEHDLEIVSRYVEFCDQNLGTYSIELAHLLFAAASEVDVVAKLLCERFEAGSPRTNINDYGVILLNAFGELPATQVFVPRYGLTLTPWEDWKPRESPHWWRSYNKVKHERNEHFHQATLKNALNAVGALLILTFHHYRYELAPTALPLLPKDTTRLLLPESTLLRFHEDYYHAHLLLE